MTSGEGRLPALGLIAAVVVAMAFAASPRDAGAHDHNIPRAKAISKRAWQRGRLQSFCWITGPPGTGKACAGGAYTWPPRDRTPAGKPAKVRINKSQRPRKLKLTRWRRIDDRGAPIGTGKSVSYRLSPVVHRETVKYEARFYLPKKRGHYYLKVYGVWPDVLSGEKQNATWNFHLKLR